MSNIYLLGTARTGTTFLRNLLEKSETVHFYGEFLFPGFFEWGFYNFQLEAIKEDPSYVFKGKESLLFNMYFDSLKEKHAGKTIFYDLKMEQANDFPGIINSVFTAKNKFVYLTRTDLFAQVVSEKVMYERIKAGDKVVHRSDVPKVLTLEHPPVTYLNAIRSKQYLNEKYLSLLKTRQCDFHETTYEKLTGSNKQQELEQLSAYLSLELDSFEGELKKQNSKNLRDIVVNYDEVLRFLSSNGFDVVQA